MEIIVKGTSDQKFDIPDPTPPYNDLAIKAQLADHEARLKKLESASVPVPPNPILTDGLYAPDSVWRKKLADNALVHLNSTGFVSELTAINRINGPWINIGTPIYFVRNTDLKAPIFLTDANNAASPIGQELAKGINIPQKLVGSQVDSDKSCAIINLDTDIEYNIWQITFNVSKNRYEGVSAGILKNASKSNGTLSRYAYWNSVRATHLPLGGGMDLKKELDSFLLPHAAAIALGRAKTTFVPPATSSDGWENGVNSIPEGMRFRFPSNISINQNWSPWTKMKVIQIRDYGMVVCDKTGNSNVFYVEGMAQYGVSDGYQYMKSKFWNNKELWDIIGSKNMDTEFPWSKLVALA